MIEFDEKSKVCLICNSCQIRKYNAKAFDSGCSRQIQIQECKNCFFAWQYPYKRTELESIAWFESAYSSPSQQYKRTEYFDENRKREIANLEYEFISSLPIKNKSILDVGAGAGIFSEVVAKKNYTVTAIDPAMDEQKFKDNPDVMVIKGTIDQLPDEQRFDVITLWDVIEHVPSPIGLISKLNKHLNKDGWLILETGNYKSANRVQAGVDHWIFQEDHKWYFSPASLKIILKKLGFVDIRVCKKTLRPKWKGSCSYIGPSKKQLLKEILSKPHQIVSLISRFFLLKKVINWEYSGLNIFTIAAKKR